ncbi:glycosyltransferase family protein [Empedobacter falsenii]
MISIIVSSYQDEFFNDFNNSIIETIGEGVIYEVIKIDNPGKYSISEAYNLGIYKSKYDNLLFIHEDLTFIVKNWGKILIDYLKNKELGVVGIAGSTYIPNTPLGWSGLIECSYKNLIQSNKFKDNYVEFSLDKDIYGKSLDGVFLACRKDIALKYKFEENLSKFHCYDFVFSNRVSKDYKNLISSKIKLVHFSKGNRNNEWMDSLIKSRSFYEIGKQKNILKYEIKAYYYYGMRLNQYGYSNSFIIKELIKYNQFNKLYLFGYPILFIVLFKIWFKKYK